MLQKGFVVLVLSIVAVSALVRPIARPRFCKSPNANHISLGMSAKTLAIVKERYTGRADLPSIMDAIDDDCLLTEEMVREANIDMADPPQLGDTVTGYVVEMDDSGAFIEIGGKMSGFLPLDEASLSPLRHVKEVLEVGQTVTAEMIGTLRGVPVVSLRSAQLLVAWEAISRVRAADQELTVRVLEVNRGGAVCSTPQGLRAFLPGSHYQGTPDESIVGSDIKVKILDVIEEEGKLVVSQRLALAASAPALAKNSLVTGTVTGLRPYGAFVEVEGGYSGLLHISQISSDRVDDVSQVFSMGERLQVVVLEHDRSSGRVALSTKVLETAPGQMLADKAGVQARAQENLDKYLERQEVERVAREAAARELAASMSASLSMEERHLGGGVGSSAGAGAGDNAVLGDLSDLNSSDASSDATDPSTPSPSSTITSTSAPKPSSRGRKPREPKDKGAAMGKVTITPSSAAGEGAATVAAPAAAPTDMFSISESIESILASIVADNASSSASAAKK